MELSEERSATQMNQRILKMVEYKEGYKLEVVEMWVMRHVGDKQVKFQPTNCADKNIRRGEGDNNHLVKILKWMESG